MILHFTFQTTFPFRFPPTIGFACVLPFPCNNYGPGMSSNRRPWSFSTQSSQRIYEGNYLLCVRASTTGRGLTHCAFRRITFENPRQFYYFRRKAQWRWKEKEFRRGLNFARIGTANETAGNTECFDVNKKQYHKLTLPHGSRKRY